MRTLVTDIVREDERFVWEGDVHVGLDEMAGPRRDLSSVAFTVVDLETTGGTPGFTKITEIGAVRVEEGAQVATFSQLVDPAQAHPGQDHRHHRHQPARWSPMSRRSKRSCHASSSSRPTRCWWPTTPASTSPSSTTSWASCSGAPSPGPPSTRCVWRAASCPTRAPHWPHLAERFDTTVGPHRALRDAQATAEVLLILLAMVQEHGLSTLEEVARFCEPRRAAQLPQDRAHREAAADARRLRHARRRAACRSTSARQSACAAARETTSCRSRPTEPGRPWSCCTTST